MKQRDLCDQLQDAVRNAYQARRPLNIVGGNSKRFYVSSVEGETLSLAEHCGIVDYEPSELVVTARAGTPIEQLQSLLAKQRQMLAFEPPSFSPNATIGGTVSCNFSGPRRAYAGSLRDHMLGCRIINGKGELLRFGGQVMKNVAGYDVTRLVTGALGCLGVITEVSLKVVPAPELEQTLCLELDETQAIKRMRELAASPLPVSATCYYRGVLFIRLSGSEVVIKSVAARLGGESMENGADFWHSLKEQQHEFFRSQWPLWRFSVAPDKAPFPLQGEFLYEWGGALRWYLGSDDVAELRLLAETGDGHLSCFRNAINRQHVFHPLSPLMKKLHNKLKMAFDPEFILNRGKMYAWM